MSVFYSHQSNKVAIFRELIVSHSFTSFIDFSYFKRDYDEFQWSTTKRFST